MRRIGVGSIYAYSRAKPMPESVILAATKSRHDRYDAGDADMARRAPNCKRRADSAICTA